MTPETCPRCEDSVETKTFGYYDSDTADYKGGRWHKFCIEQDREDERSPKVIRGLFETEREAA